MTFNYNNLRYSVALIGIFLSASSSSAQVGKYPIKNYTPVDYEAGIQNIGFAQNRDMAMFVANNLGVLSFNGTTWTTHAYRTGKKQRSLDFDEDTDRLYVGSQGEFGYFEQDWNYVSLVDKIPEGARDFDEVWDVFITDSKIFFCTFQGIYEYDGTTISVIKNIDGLNKSFSVGNRLYTQNSSGKLFEVRGQKLHPTIRQNQNGQIISGIIPKDEGLLLFYNSGTIEFSSALGASEVYPSLMKALSGQYINHVLQLSDSRLVISTQRSGLYVYEAQTNSIENINSQSGLQSSACLRTFQDHTGNLWVGMQNGLAHIDINSPTRLISEEINLQGSGYDAFDATEGTYYTTSNGIYFRPTESSTCIFLKGTEGPAYSIQRIQNKLYAGHHTGLFLLDDGVAKRCATTNGLWQVKHLRSHPNYAIGGTYSGLYLFKINEQMELEGIQKINGFDESSRFFEEDKNGSIWVGQFYKGLYQLLLKEDLLAAEVKKVSDESALPIQEHIILSKVDEELLLGTEEGIFKIDQKTNQIVTADPYSKIIGKNWIYLMVQGNQQYVYIVSEGGVGYVRQVSADNFVYVPSSLFELRHSFNNDLLNVSVNVKEGVLFNANEGFIYYNPEMEDRMINEQKPIISRVYDIAENHILFTRLPFEKRVDQINEIVITEGLKVLEFTVESFEFAGVGNKRFRYFLKGFDEDYSQWTIATAKEYTNLKEGKYEFFAQTLNAFGEEITSETLFLTVSPPFYRTAWMKAIYSFLIVLTLYLAYRSQRQYYKRKERRIEKARQEELMQKQNELQHLKEEQIQTELEHVNNLLAASTMNLVVKNEFMENIKEELKTVNLTGEVNERSSALEKIVKEIDTALRLNDDWKQFEYHFDRVHGDFLTRLTNEFTDLTPGEQKLAHF